MMIMYVYFHMTYESLQTCCYLLIEDIGNVRGKSMQAVQAPSRISESRTTR